MNIDKILKSIDNLPAFPATVQKVLQLTGDPDYSMSELVKVVELDQAVTANVLRMCNSAYFGVRYKISALREALAYIGADNIVRIVNAAGISKLYKKKVKGYYPEATGLWEHSVGVALMSQILSRKIYNREDSRVFTAGLLHDIGKVVLGEFVYESFQEIMDFVSTEGYSFLEAEEKVIGIDHARLGGKIASLWNFPREITDPIAFHHRPDLMKEGDNADVWLVYLADQACLMMGIGGGADGLAYRGLGGVIDKFKLRQKDFEECMVMLLKELEKAKELVDLVEKR